MTPRERGGTEVRYWVSYHKAEAFTICLAAIGVIAVVVFG